MNENDRKSRYWIATQKSYFNKDIRYSLITSEAKDLSDKVVDNSGLYWSDDLAEEAFSCLLANFYHAYVLDAPLIYSRNSNKYGIERKRYGYEFYTYKKIVRLVDTMDKMGLVIGTKGWKQSDGRCYSSKIWATEKLVEMLLSMGGTVFIKQNKEVLYLKDKNKLLQDYKETSRTKRLRHQVCEFNEMLSSLQIDFSFKYSDLSDRPKHRINQINKLERFVLTNQITIPNIKNKLSWYKYQTQSKQRQTDIPTRQLSGPPVSAEYYIDIDHDTFLSKKLNELDIIGSINTEANFMRRVFNVNWSHGGRFYQAPHLTIPSPCRRNFLINKEPTVELDYSGLHIRMLYQLIGIDYRDECYVYYKEDADNKSERDRIKTASLIIINSNCPKKAIKAIQNELRKKGLQYPVGSHEKYKALMDRFEEHHPRIKEFLLSGKGLELQYIDSKIMANILDRLTINNIPALPVHDSVICPASHEGFLRQVMTEEYEKIMKFKPVF